MYFYQCIFFNSTFVSRLLFVKFLVLSRQSLTSLGQSEADLRMSHRSELASLECQQRVRLSELEQQLAGQRQRTSALLEERDAELRQLRAAGAPDPAAVTGVLSQLGLDRQEGPMLHYMQVRAGVVRTGLGAVRDYWSCVE